MMLLVEAPSATTGKRKLSLPSTGRPHGTQADARCNARASSLRRTRGDAADRRRLPQHQRLVALAGGDRAGGRRAAGAGLPMADAGANVRQHLHQLRQQKQRRQGPAGPHRDSHDAGSSSAFSSPALSATLLLMWLFGIHWWMGAMAVRADVLLWRPWPRGRGRKSA